MVPAQPNLLRPFPTQGCSVIAERNLEWGDLSSAPPPHLRSPCCYKWLQVVKSFTLAKDNLFQSELPMQSLCNMRISKLYLRRT